MDPKAMVGYLVGYDGDERYRIYIPEKRDVVVSRDVVFHEKVGNCDNKTVWPVKKDKSGEAKEDRVFKEKPVEDASDNEPNPVTDDSDKESSEDSDSFSSLLKTPTKSTKPPSRERNSLNG